MSKKRVKPSPTIIPTNVTYYRYIRYRPLYILSTLHVYSTFLIWQSESQMIIRIKCYSF